MAALLPVGMPLAQALNAASGVASGDVSAALLEVRARVERGDTLSTALAEHPRLFSPLYVGLVRAGERSGDIDAAFARLADQLERDEAAPRQGPLGVDLSDVARDGGLDRGDGAAVLRAAAVRDAARGKRRQAAAVHRDAARVLGGAAPRLAGAAAAFRSSSPRSPRGCANTDEGRRVWSRDACSRCPACATLRRYALAGRFARLVGVLLGGGAPLLTALDDTIESIGDPIARDDVVRIRTRVREGSSLRARASPTARSFRRCSRSSIGVGEDAGQLARVPHEGGRHLRGAHRARDAAAGDARRAGDDRDVRRDRGVRRAVAAAGDLRHQRELVQVMPTAQRADASAGFTLWELTMVLLVMAIAATLAAPAFARFGTEQPAAAADAMLGLLRDARKAAIDYNATVTLRLDPKTLQVPGRHVGRRRLRRRSPQGTLDTGLSADAR